MSQEQHRFEWAIVNNVDYWREQIARGQLNQQEHYRDYFANYFSLRDNMFDVIGEGEPLNGEGIVEYAEGLVRMDGASQKEASEYVGGLARAFVGKEGETQPILLEVDGRRGQRRIFSPTNDGTNETFALSKNEELRDFNRLNVASPPILDHTLLVNGRYTELYGRGSGYPANIWTSPSTVEMSLDVRFIEVVEDPEEVNKKIKPRDKGTIVYVGEAATQALRKYLSWQEKLHVDAVSALLATQGINIGKVEIDEDASSNSHLRRPFSEANTPAEQTTEFIRDYVATIYEGSYGADELKAAGVPAILHPKVIEGIVSPDDINEAVIAGFVEAANVMTDEYRGILRERIERGLPLQIGRLVTEATTQQAETFAELLSQIDGNDLIQLDKDRTAEFVRGNRGAFRKIVLPPDSPHWIAHHPEDDSPAIAALRKYAKTGSFKKRS